MKAKNKIITAVLLSTGAAVGTALINKYIKMSAVARNLLTQPEPRCYRWRLGNIYYTKTGTGKPLLLVHDLTHASSSCEWDSLIPLLKEYYTVYTIDLLGCGRSEKPNLTYTNFLYVQLLNDFVKSEIGRIQREERFIKAMISQMQKNFPFVNWLYAKYYWKAAETNITSSDAASIAYELTKIPIEDIRFIILPG